MAVIDKTLAPGVAAGEVEGTGTALVTTGGSGVSNSGNVVNTNSVVSRASSADSGIARQSAVIQPQGISGISGNLRLANAFTPETNRIAFDDSPIPEPQRSYDFRVYLPTIQGTLT